MLINIVYIIIFKNHTNESFIHYVIQIGRPLRHHLEIKLACIKNVKPKPDL